MSTTLYLYHHGDFSPPPNVKYMGGKVEVIHDFDSDTLSFRDLEEFAKKYDYDVNSLVYFKCDGHSFKQGTRVVYDDISVRDLIALCKPHGKIELYVDHFNLDELIDVPPSPKQTSDTTMHKTQKLGAEIELEEGGNGSEGEYSEDTDDPDDPEYKKDTESEDSDDPDISDDNVSDEEYHIIKKNANKFKGNMCNSMIDRNRTVSEDSGCENENLRSLSSSSEDENAKIGYIGPSNY